jgi:signal transduction histidine kinase
MKPSKLYIKIALTFVAMFFVVLIGIFTLFYVYPGKHFTTQLEKETRTKVLMVKRIIEDESRSVSTTDLLKNESLANLIFNLGEILEAKVWLQNSDGIVSLKSFHGDIPERLKKIKRWWKFKEFGDFQLYHQGHTGFYAVVPVSLSEGEKGSIHILFDRPGPPSPQGGFAVGLFIIGLIIAPLIIPISKFVIKPLKKLSESALQIADGDLSHRAPVTSKDEIGQLCESFNFMADKLEGMIMSGKELTANVSHELRTPLTRIRVAEEMLREKLEQGNIKDWTRHLDEIREDISELDILIGRILELSKLDIQESPLAFESIDPPDIIHNLLKKLQPVIDQKVLRVTTNLSFQPPFMGDKEAIGSALMNLLDNAIKFTPKKGDILVQMNSESDLLHISITNTHEAIPEDELTRIFDPFHRIKQTKTTGSGLGLAITRKIIERHGGNITAKNTEKGLEINITIPTHPPSNPK